MISNTRNLHLFHTTIQGIPIVKKIIITLDVFLDNKGYFKKQNRNKFRKGQNIS